MRTTSAVSSKSRFTIRTLTSTRSTKKSYHDGSARPTRTSTVCSIRSPSPDCSMDPFQNITTDQPAMHIWRVEEKRVVPVQMSDHGFFHEEGAYVVLNIGVDGECSLHYWFGRSITHIERNTAREKAHILDRVLNCADIFSKETMHHESYCFHRNFPQGIVYLEGKPKTKSSLAALYTKRLYVVSGRKFVRASCVDPSTDVLKSRNACILDGLPRMYVWIGSKCEYTKRLKAIQIAKMMRAWQRQGKAHIMVVDEAETDNNNQFIKKINNIVYHERRKSLSSAVSDLTINGDSAFMKSTNRCISAHTRKEAKSGTACGSCGSLDDLYDDTTPDEIVLHRISGDRAMYDMAEAARKPLQHCYLVKQDTYLLDTGPNRPIYIWNGHQAIEEDVYASLRRAQNFTKHKGYPDYVPICRIRENNEPPSFRKCFNNWRNHTTSNSQVTKCYSAGNIERNLFTRSDNRTIAKQYEVWSEDLLFDVRGQTEVFTVNDGQQESLPWGQHGVFNNGSCYIVKHITRSHNNTQTIIYYWIGEKCVHNQIENAEQLAFEMAKHDAVVMRVLDTKEPRHFMAVLQNTIIVYDHDLSTTSTKQLFCVREFKQDCVRVSQFTGPTKRSGLLCTASPVFSNRPFVYREVPAQHSSLNSSAALILLNGVDCYIWYGKLSGATEREFSKNILGFLNPLRMYAFDIVTEGKESKPFLDSLGEPGVYESEFENKVLERRYARLVCCGCNSGETEFDDVEEFTQEDLASDEVMILDTFDQIYIWCGEERYDDWANLPNMAKSYIENDSAGRLLCDVDIWFVAQNAEPPVFTKHFTIWEPNNYQCQASYEFARKLLRQENLKISVNDEGFDQFIAKYPFHMLKLRDVPEDVDPSHRECHLTDEHFLRVLKITREEFHRLPEWKQSQIVQSSRISRYNVLTTENS